MPPPTPDSGVVKSPRAKRPADDGSVVDNSKQDDRPKKKRFKVTLNEQQAAFLNENFGPEWMTCRLRTPDAVKFHKKLIAFFLGIPLKKTAKRDADLLRHAIYDTLAIKNALEDPESCKVAVTQYRREIENTPVVKAMYEEAFKQFQSPEEIIKKLEYEVACWRGRYLEMVEIAGKECNNIDDLVHAMDRNPCNVQFWKLEDIKDYDWGLMGEAAKRLVSPNGDDESTDEEDQ